MINKKGLTILMGGRHQGKGLTKRQLNESDVLEFQKTIKNLVIALSMLPKEEQEKILNNIKEGKK